MADARHSTPLEYLEIERASEYKSEYLDGAIYPMTSANSTWCTIAVNIVGEIGLQLKRHPDCQALGSDMRITPDPERFYTYAALIVCCGPCETAEVDSDTLTNPCVIVEILKPETEAFIRGRKFELYMVNPDGTGLEQVTNFGGFTSFPEFSPDGNKLVYASDAGAKQRYEFNIFVADWK